MSIWQFNAAVAGWIKANTPSKGDRLSEGEKSSLFEWLTAGNENDREVETAVYRLDESTGRLVAAGRIRFVA